MGCNCGGARNNARVGRLVRNGGMSVPATKTRWRVTFSNDETYIDDSLLKARRMQRQRGGTLDAVQEEISRPSSS